MQEKTQQQIVQATKKQPITIKFSTQNKPKRIHSLINLKNSSINKQSQSQSISIIKNKDNTNYNTNINSNTNMNIYENYNQKKQYIQHQLFDHKIVKNNIKIYKQLKKLHTIFIYNKIPQFYAYNFMNRLLNTSQQKLQDYIIRQLQDIKNKQSYYHVISNSIKARQLCIKQLVKCINNLQNNIQDKIIRNVLRQEIKHYRKLTMFVIAHIRAWKQYLYQISAEISFTIYVYNGEDYLLKLLNDCQFIFNSFLTKFMKFSYKNDPYIMRPYLQARKQRDNNKQKQQDRLVQLFSFNQQEQGKYMIDINYLAEERAKYLQSKMNSKFDKIKEIQKIYGYRDSPLQSRVYNVRKTPSSNKARNKNKQQLQLQIQKQIQQKGVKNTIFNNFMTKNLQQSEKRIKLQQINRNTQKLKKIKQSIHNNNNYNNNGKQLINQNMFDNIQRSNSEVKLKYKNKYDITPFEQKLKYSQLRSKKKQYQSLNIQSDFQSLLRKKQLQILKVNQNKQSLDGTKTHRPFKGIKIKDNLSESKTKKFITKQQGFIQLQKVLNQLQTFSPQKLQNFKNKRLPNDPLALSSSQTVYNNSNKSQIKLINNNLSPQKSLVEKNKQVYTNLRNQIINQIETDLNNKAQYQQNTIKQNQKIQQILQNKINEQSMKVIQNSKIKKLQGRQHLSKQLQSQQLFGYQTSQSRLIKNSQKLSFVQQQLRKQMRLKWLREVQDQLKRKTQLNQLQNIKIAQDKQLNKQLQKVREKQQLQKRYEQIQKQQRAKAIRERMQLDQQRKQEIQTEMKTIIQREKQRLQKIATLEKRQLQNDLKQQMKAELLANIKQQNQVMDQQTKRLLELRKNQQQFKNQARAKIEKQYMIGHQMKQNRDREIKVAKLRLIKQKFNQYDKLNKNTSQVQQNSQSQIKQKTQIFDEKALKSQIAQVPDLRTGIFPKYAANDFDKKKLREQFQLQLFAFRKAETYDNIQGNSEGKIYETGSLPLSVKDYKSKIQDQLKSKQQQKLMNATKNQNKQQAKQEININKSQVELQKNIQKSQVAKSIKNSQVSQKFTRFSQTNNKMKNNQYTEQDQLIRMKLGMSVQQYKVYKKKKNAISNKRDIQTQNQKKKQYLQKDQIKVSNQYQKVGNMNRNISQNFKEINPKDFQNEIQGEDMLFDSASVVAKNNNNETKQQQNKSPIKKQKKQIIQENLQQLNENVKIDKKNSNKKIKDDDVLQQQDMQQKPKKSPKKKKKNKQVSQQQISQVSQETSIVNRHFATSDEDEQRNERKLKKSKKKSPKKKKKVIQQKISEQSELSQQNKSPKKQQKYNKQKLNKQPQPQIQQLTLQIPQPNIAQKVTTTKIRYIPVNLLSDFFTDHFQHLPKIIKKLNIYKKQQLIKYILQHPSFTILQYIKQSISIGFGIIIYNNNKIKYRSLNIVHLGSYDEIDYLQLLLSIVRYCFKNDPCQQIALSLIYDKQIQDQAIFMKIFQKKFDPYGAIFEKKIFNSQYQRKFVLRRNFGQIYKGQIIQTNYGNIKISINNYLLQSYIQQQIQYLTQSDKYQPSGINIGYYGIIGHILSQKYNENILALMITKGNNKQSTNKQKLYSILAKLGLAISKNKSFQYLQNNQYQQYKYNTIFALNLQLINKKQTILPFPPQHIQKQIQISHFIYNNDIQLLYSFYSQYITINIQQQQDIYQQYICKYLQYTPSKKSKIIQFKSKIYSSIVKILPCKSNKYKIFIMDCQEYDGLQKQYNNNILNNIQNSNNINNINNISQDRIDLGTYIRLLFANKLQSQIKQYQHIWIPQINIKGNKNEIQIFKYLNNIQKQYKNIQDEQFQPKYKKNTQNTNTNKDKQQNRYKNGVIKSKLNLTYTNYLKNSLKLQPNHRDLLITPPFIFGVLNMQIQTAQQGSPIYIKRIDKFDLNQIKIVQKKKKDLSD